MAFVRPKAMASLVFFATRNLFGTYAFALPPTTEFKEIIGHVLACGDILILPLQRPASVLYNEAVKAAVVKNYRVPGEIFAGLTENRKTSLPSGTNPVRV